MNVRKIENLVIIATEKRNRAQMLASSGEARTRKAWKRAAKKQEKVISRLTKKLDRMA